MRCTDDDVRVGVIGHGGLLREFLRSSDKRFWVCLGDFFSRHAQTAGDLCFAIQFKFNLFNLT